MARISSPLSVCYTGALLKLSLAYYSAMITVHYFSAFTGSEQFKIMNRLKTIYPNSVRYLQRNLTGMTSQGDIGQ